MRNLENRLSTLEQRQCANGRTFCVWREDNVIYHQRLAETQAKPGPIDKIVVIGWLPSSRPRDLDETS